MISLNTAVDCYQIFAHVYTCAAVVFICKVGETLVYENQQINEVQTSPMLASGVQLVTCMCYIHMLVALNATKYVIMPLQD